MNEREKAEKEREKLWKQIQEISASIEELEKKIRDFYDNKDKPKQNQYEEVKVDMKRIVSIKEKIEEAYEDKRRKREQFEEEERLYCEQQSQYMTAKWVAKRKQELIKLRCREEKEQKLKYAKCLELVEICEKIMSKYKKNSTQEANPQTTNDELIKEKAGSKDNQKKKKKKKQKKTETLITALELDTLRTQFEFFEVPVPVGKDDLGVVIKALYRKANEIENKPLPESIAPGSGKGEDSDERSSDSLSLSMSGMSPSITSDTSSFEINNDT